MADCIKKIDVFRHAESTSNAGLASGDCVTIPLTDKGMAQARTLSQTFNDRNPPGAIIVSPYIRTALTASPTRQRFPGAKYMVWPVHEFTYLAIDMNEGTTQRQRQPLANIYWQRNDPDWCDGPGAESFNDLVARVDRALEDLADLPYAYSAMFSHGLTMRLMFLRLSEPSLTGRNLMQRTDKLRRNYSLPNTACLPLVVKNGRVQLTERWPAAIARREGPA